MCEMAKKTIKSGQRPREVTTEATVETEEREGTLNEVVIVILRIVEAKSIINNWYKTTKWEKFCVGQAIPDKTIINQPSTIVANHGSYLWLKINIHILIFLWKWKSIKLTI